MAEWKLHVPSEDNLFLNYKCGLVAGQRVALRKDLVICNHRDDPTGKIYPKGDVWLVLPGITSDPVLWFRQKDGNRHTWDDDFDSVQEWFEVIDSAAEEPGAVRNRGDS